MNGMTSRLDLVMILAVSVVVGVTTGLVSGPTLGLLGGCATLAVVALASTSLRLSREMSEVSEPVAREIHVAAETPPAKPEVTEERDERKQTEVLLSRVDDLAREWQSGLQATTEFRRGLVGELARSFSDLQLRLDRLELALEELTSANATLRRDVVGLKHEVRGIPKNVDLLHQMEAIVTLRGMMRGVPLPLPVSGGWRVSPTTLLRYLELLGTGETHLVVECGSGVSSLWVGHRLRQLGKGRCIALEHDPQFLSESEGLVRAHALDDIVDVRLAPLSEGPSPWYDRGAIEDIQDIDVLFVDGPPGAIAKNARRPALEVLGPRMRTGGHILVDDSSREDEAAVISGWLETGLVRLSESSTDYKGWTILEYVGPVPA
jgi:hypothetical protein